MSWKNVLDCKKWYGDLHLIIQAAKSVGYEFFTWNGWVYKVNGEYADRTEIKVEELN